MYIITSSHQTEALHTADTSCLLWPSKINIMNSIAHPHCTKNFRADMYVLLRKSKTWNKRNKYLTTTTSKNKITIRNSYFMLSWRCYGFLLFVCPFIYIETPKWSYLFCMHCTKVYGFAHEGAEATLFRVWILLSLSCARNATYFARINFVKLKPRDELYRGQIFVFIW